MNRPGRLSPTNSTAVPVSMSQSLIGRDAFTGVRLLIDSDSRDLGQVAMTESRSLEFHLFNRSGSPVTILGGRVSCNCLQPDPFPFTLQPGESRVFGVRFRPKPKPGPVSETLTLFTDDPERRDLVVKIVATVLAKASSR